MKKIILATLVAGMTFASANDTIVGAKVGTLGFGLETVKKYSDKVDFRLAGNYFKYSTSGTEDDVDYDIDLKLATLGVIADYHPFSNGFMLSGGLYYNGNSVTLDANPNAAVQIGDNTYGVTSIHGDVDFNTVAPYLGIGYSNATKNGKGWSFTSELGVLFQGKPDVTLDVQGTGVSDSDIAKEESILEDELNSLQYYPVLSIGFTYKF